MPKVHSRSSASDPSSSSPLCAGASFFHIQPLNSAPWNLCLRPLDPLLASRSRVEWSQGGAGHGVSARLFVSPSHLLGLCAYPGRDRCRVESGMVLRGLESGSWSDTGGMAPSRLRGPLAQCSGGLPEWRPRNTVSR